MQALAGASFLPWLSLRQKNSSPCSSREEGSLQTEKPDWLYHGSSFMKSNLREMIELNSRGWTCLSLPGLGGSTALPAGGTSPHAGMSRGGSLSLPGLLETIPSICAFHSSLLFNAAAIAFFESLGDALKSETQMRTYPYHPGSLP